MKTTLSIDRFTNDASPRVLAAGFFDGVHAGHRRVIQAALAHARGIGAEAWALTFDQHPQAVLNPEKRPPLLTPLPLRIERLAATGLDGCLMLPFTERVAAMSPEEFLGMLCGGRQSLKAMFSGPDWRFGKGGRGTVRQLVELAERFGFDAITVPPHCFEDLPVSSSRIRQAIRAGDLERAAAMLTYPYTIRETVVRGRGVGKHLGMATANLHPGAEVLPPLGVYVVRVGLGDLRIAGVANLGLRPTFADARTVDPVLELHLFDFEGDLYGSMLDIALLSRLRDERRFETPDALRAQVRGDIEEAQRRLKKMP